jgi:ABC-type cobalamin/Fe3+-siderophores transport system ATPase subunit
MDRGRIVAEGSPADTLTAARIAEIFGIEVTMIETDQGRLPIPQRPL